MSPAVLNLAMFGSLIALLLSGAPLFAVIGALGILFGLLVGGPQILPMFAMRVYELMVSYSLVAVPLFILMANLLQRSGIIEELFTAVFQWSGRVRGSIAIATIISGVIMAAMIGVVGASVITLGLLALPDMFRRHYNKHLAVGTVCAAGALGILIPPSIMPIFYSSVTQTSIIELFAGSIIPGLLLGLLFCGYIFLSVIRRPDYAPAITEEERIIGWREKLALGKNLVAPVIIIACVLGAILAGIASPTEASGVGVFAVLVLLALRKKLNFQVLRESLFSTINATGMALWIAFASTCFVGAYAMGGGQDFASSLIMNMPGGRWGVLIFTQIVYIILGMFVDWIGICLLIVPIFTPILINLGFDPVWVGIIFMLNMQISFLSPPFGYALFFVKGITPQHVSMGDIWRSVVPFLCCQVAGLVLCILFPQLVLWLPNQLK